jgi:hypothetical protein
MGPEEKPLLVYFSSFLISHTVISKDGFPFNGAYNVEYIIDGEVNTQPLGGL